VYVDEVDKLAFVPNSSGGGTSVNTRDVQTSLLKLMEDGEVKHG
jgi:ATP-dependent protease Clp ATPase subunit